MGYFSNGTEGEMYHHRWCSQCLNDDVENDVFCPIWSAHLAHNGNPVLAFFIPCVEGENGKCTMYRPVEKEEGVIKLDIHLRDGRLVF